MHLGCGGGTGLPSYAAVAAASFTTAVSSADAAVDVVVTGLTGDTLYHVYCAAEVRELELSELAEQGVIEGRAYLPVIQAQIVSKNLTQCI